MLETALTQEATQVLEVILILAVAPVQEVIQVTPGAAPDQVITVVALTPVETPNLVAVQVQDKRSQVVQKEVF